MHGTVILDPSNESCDIGLWYASEAERKGTFVAMDKMVLQERAKGVLGNKIVAVLTGVFLAKPKREHAPVLEAEQVENLELESSDPKSGDGKRN